MQAQMNKRICDFIHPNIPRHETAAINFIEARYRGVK
jgi:hypothetical protein